MTLGNGFRKERACIVHIFALQSMVNNKINHRLNTISVFFRFKWAFDSF